MKIRKKTVNILCAMTLSLSLFWGMGVFAVYAEEGKRVSGGSPETAKSGGIAMEVEYGYDDTAKGGRYVPVEVRLENQRDAHFQGSLKLLSMESDYEIYRYDYPVSVEPKAIDTMRMEIPFGAGSDQLFVSLSDADGSEILRKRMKMNVSLEVPELFIGLLCDTPDKLQYLNGVGINYSALKTRTFDIRTENFPSDQIGLDLLDVIVVSNYDLRRLSEEQTRAIMDWVRKGGVLVMGTGMRVKDTLGRFAPELLEDSYGTVEVMQVDMGADYAVDSPSDAVLDIPCVEVSLHGGNVLMSNDGFPLFSATSKEKGLIAVAAYDFVDISDFCQEQPSYVDRMFTSLLGDDRINRLADYLYSGNSNEFWSVQSLINTGDVDRLPDITFYAAVILLYVIVIGPGLYLFLKKKQKRIHYRAGVMAAAVCFTGLIYLLGSRTRFKTTFFTYATIQDVSEDLISESTYINMRNPYKEPYSVELDPSYSVRPITRSYRYDGKPRTKFTGDENFTIDINHKPAATTISAQNIIAFNPKYFKLEKKFLNAQKVGITGSINYFDGKITGSVTNNFETTVENTAILMYGHMILLNEMEPGETRQLDGLPVLNTPLDYPYVVAQHISGGYQYEKADIGDKDYLLSQERTSMLMFYMENYLYGYSPDARVVAFSREKSDSQFLQLNKYDTYGITMLTSSLEVNATRDGRRYRSALIKSPTVANGNYNPMGNSIYGMEPVTLEYSLGNDLDVEKLSFYHISPEFTEDPSFRLTPFTGKRYLYNHSSGSYDLLDENTTDLDREQLSPYLSPGNTITVKYLYDNSTTSNWEITLPMLMVTGREK